MRHVGDKEQFTPFGLWIREYCRDSATGLCVTNLDFVFEDYKQHKIMLVEEKQNGGKVQTGQELTFRILDLVLRVACPYMDPPYEYWGFYALTMPRSCTMVGPGILLNETPVTVEQLQAHLNFEERAADPKVFKFKKGGMSNEVAEAVLHMIRTGAVASRN